MSKKTTSREILARAADLLETVGWTQRAYGRNAKGHPLVPSDTGVFPGEPTCYCLVGAVLCAAGDKAVLCAAGEGLMGSPDMNEVLRALAISIMGRPTSLSAWNDEPYRTQGEVVAALRKAATEC